MKKLYNPKYYYLMILVYNDLLILVAFLRLLDTFNEILKFTFLKKQGRSLLTGAPVFLLYIKKTEKIN